MKTYAKLTEHNEWEGETWHFYIPIEGNEEELDWLQGAMGSASVSGDEFELNLFPLLEVEVDILVRRDVDTGYMPKHNKLSGTLTLPNWVLTGVQKDELLDLLYKGGIVDCVK